MIMKTKSLISPFSGSAGKNRFYTDQFQESVAVLQKSADQCKQPLFKAAALLVTGYRQGRKLLLCGNGGSAADAQHLAAELVIRLSKKIDRPGLAAIALTTDTSALTAGANDLGFERVFARQVEALGQPGDVLLVISTSGNSPNLVQALHMAKNKKLKRIALLGGDGGRCKKLVQIPIIVPSSNTQRIQEVQILLGHILIELVETELFS